VGGREKSRGCRGGGGSGEEGGQGREKRGEGDKGGGGTGEEGGQGEGGRGARKGKGLKQ
jgi:hypothetical protein